MKISYMDILVIIGNLMLHNHLSMISYNRVASSIKDIVWTCLNDGQKCEC